MSDETPDQQAEMTGEPAIQEPTDEDMADLLGEEAVPGVILPTGAQANMQPETNAGAAPPPEAFKRNQPTASQLHEEGVNTPTDASGLLLTDAIDSSQTLDAPAQLDEPETNEMVIQRLPKEWMRAYIRELMRSGSPGEARAIAGISGGGISAGWVTKHIAEYPDFARLSAEALQGRHERVGTAIFRGATEGHDIPLVSQGEIIGSFKKPCVKSAELYLKQHGLMAADQVNVTHSGRVELADESQMAEMLRSVALLLHSQPKQIQGKVVSESDKKEG